MMSIQCSVFGIQWTIRRWVREVVCGVFADRDSMFVAAKGGGILDHFSEHSADFLGQHSEPLGLFACDVAVVERDKNPVLSFQILAVSVSQFPVFSFRCSVLSETASAGKEHRTGNTAYCILHTEH